MSGFTKGPWILGPYDQTGYVIIDDYQSPICSCIDDVGDTNAHLIAAAPDGYYMAQGVVEAYEATKAAFVRKDLQPHYDAAIAFIAKADGETS